MEFKALSHFSNKPTVRILVHVSLRTGTRVIFRSGITELNDMHALNFTRFCPIAFQMVLPNYTQHKERGYVSPHLHQYLLLLGLNILPILMAVKWHFCGFKLYFLDTSEVEHFFRTPLL